MLACEKVVGKESRLEAESLRAGRTYHSLRILPATNA